MHDLMYVQFGRQRREELMREAEMDRLAREARGDREKRPDHRRPSEPVRVADGTRRSSPRGPGGRGGRGAERGPS